MCVSSFVSKCTCLNVVCRTLLRMCLYSIVSCINSSMRLVGPDGPNTVEGRVEYCSNGVWGTVSYYAFDSLDGEVVCRKLGYQHPSKTLRTCLAIVLKYDWCILITHRSSAFRKLILRSRNRSNCVLCIGLWWE